MRHLLPLALLGSLAAPAKAAEPPRTPQPPSVISLPPELGDGRVFDQLGTMVGAVTRALLDLPVGQIEAAVENRPVTRDDRARTVRSVTGMDDREVDAGIEQSKGVVKAGSQAMVRALPVVIDALNKAGDEIARASANIPQPGYPRR